MSASANIRKTYTRGDQIIIKRATMKPGWKANLLSSRVEQQLVVTAIISVPLSSFCKCPKNSSTTHNDEATVSGDKG